MKLKLEDILRINNVLKSIIDNNKLKINPSLKFKLLGIMKSIENPVMNFEIIRNEKICEYGTKTEDGNIEIPNEDSDKIKNFTKDLNEIIKSDIEVNVQKLKSTEIFDKGLPADYLVGLFPLIEE